MRRASVLSCALMMIVSMFATATAQAQTDPQQLAQNCVQGLAVRSEHRIMQNGQVAESCVAEIESLLEAGDVPGARREGRQCLRRVNRSSARTVRVMERRAFRCQVILTVLGAPNLAVVVQEAAANAVESVLASRQAAAAAIRAAMPDPPQPDPEG